MRDSSRSIAHARLAGEAAGVEWLGPLPDRASLIERCAIEPRRARHSVATILGSILRDTVSRDPSLGDAIQSLENGCVVVATGQQPGLFGGPLLSLYKAATTIALRDELEAAGVPAVAVFWNASEDHDLDEANRLFAPPGGDRRESAFHTLTGLDRGPALHHITFDQAARAELEAICSSTGIAREHLPVSGADFGSWCTSLMLERTKGTGLIVCEPHWFAELLVPMRRIVVSRRRELIKAIGRRTSLLADHGFRTPIETPSERETFLFRDGAARRSKLDHHSPAEILELIEEHPTEVSSNVVSRPLAQQYLLPVVALVAGPTESEYLAQVMPAFELLDMKAPVIWPRRDLLLVRDDVAEALDFLGLDPRTMASGLLEGDRFVSRLESLPITELEEALNEALGEIERVDEESSRRELAAKRREVLAAWRTVKKARKRENRSIARPTNRAIHLINQWFWPRGRRQDRAYCAATLGEPLNSAFMGRILRETDPFDHALGILEVADEGDRR